jgi:hypothetical protein
VTSSFIQRDGTVTAACYWVIAHYVVSQVIALSFFKIEIQMKFFFCGNTIKKSYMLIRGCHQDLRTSSLVLVTVAGFSLLRVLHY